MPTQAPELIKTWLVGSTPDCDILVQQPAVSGRHCRLSQYQDGYVLEDLGSTNGTFVNGHRLQPGGPVYVTSTDQLTLGQQTALPWPIDSRTSRRQDSGPKGSRRSGGDQHREKSGERRPVGLSDDFVGARPGSEKRKRLCD